MNEHVRFLAQPATRSEEPLLIGVGGPPGGGKTKSSLRLAKGMQSVRGGDIVMLDTEAGRSRKYSDEIAFKIVEMPPTARSDVFLEAIRAQLASKPAAIIVDSMSDEHDNYLAWHDEMVPNMGNNEWAAWAKPKAARKLLIAGILKIKVPLIFTFRAREKTKQGVNSNGRKTVESIGWMPVAPLEIVHTLDLNCLLPPRADGVARWQSDKIGEDFILKLPQYLAPFIEQGKPLSEDMGAALARWAAGSSVSLPPKETHAAKTPASTATSTGQAAAQSGQGSTETWDEYCERWDAMMDDDQATGKTLGQLWNSAAHKKMRVDIGPTAEQVKELVGRVTSRIEQLKVSA